MIDYLRRGMMTASTDPSPAAIPTSYLIRKRLLSAVNWRLLVEAVVLFLLFVALFSFVQSGTSALVGTDTFAVGTASYLVKNLYTDDGTTWIDTALATVNIEDKS